MGVCPLKPNSINLRFSAFFVPIFLIFISTAGAILFGESSSIIQKAQTVAVVISEIASMVDFMLYFWEISNIVNLIEKYELFIVKSKQNINTICEFISAWM